MAFWELVPWAFGRLGKGHNFPALPDATGERGQLQSLVPWLEWKVHLKVGAGSLTLGGDTQISLRLGPILSNWFTGTGHW